MTKIEIVKKRIQQVKDRHKETLNKLMYPEFYTIDELRGVFNDPEHVKNVVGHLEKP